MNEEDQAVMNDFFETNQYVGDRRSVADAPEHGEEDPDDGIAVDQEDLIEENE